MSHAEHPGVPCSAVRAAPGAPPPPRPEAPIRGPRVGCGWCFETLNPTHPNPRKRRFVRCKKCGRPYLALHVKDGFRCTRQGCESAEFEPLEDLLLPHPLDVRPRRPIPFNSGPLNHPNDRPLGMTAGTLYLEDGEPDALVFRNNSDQSQDLPERLGPWWVSTVWRRVRQRRARATGVQADSGEADHEFWEDEPLRLAPGESARATIRARLFRPPLGQAYVKVREDQGFQVLAPQERSLFHAGWLIAILLAWLHFGVVVAGDYQLASVPSEPYAATDSGSENAAPSTARAALRASFSLSLLLGWMAFLSPELPWAMVLAGVKRFPSLEPCREWYRQTTAVPTALYLRMLTNLAAAVVVAAPVLVVGWLAWGILLGIAATLPVVVHVFGCLLYASGLGGLLAFWLRLYDFSPLAGLLAALARLQTQGTAAGKPAS